MILFAVRPTEVVAVSVHGVMACPRAEQWVSVQVICPNQVDVGILLLASNLDYPDGFKCYARCDEERSRGPTKLHTASKKLVFHGTSQGLEWQLNAGMLSALVDEEVEPRSEKV